MSKTKLSLRATGDNGRGKEEDVCVYYKCGRCSIIKEVMSKRPGWIEVKEDSECDFNWCDVVWLRKEVEYSQLKKHVKINHFFNHYELTGKNLMAKNLRKCQRKSERDPNSIGMYDFFPETYALPNDYTLFVERFKRCPGNIWIMKPAASSQGKGIFLFRELKDIVDWKVSWRTPEEDKEEAKAPSYVVQRYVENPYLINGRKFDLRIYVLVTSFVPMKAWLYRDGFARLSSTRFFLGSIHDKYMHLTNYAIQKQARDYDRHKPCKWQMQQLRSYLTAKHGRVVVETLFNSIDNIIIGSLNSVRDVMIKDKHCFELYGYDILLDESLKPWLLEVNASPSMIPSSPQDYLLKFGLLEDTLNVIDMEGRLSGKEKRVGGFDLILDDGLVFREDETAETMCKSVFGANSHLGCINNREKQLSCLFFGRGLQGEDQRDPGLIPRPCPLKDLQMH
ncbi:putative tubulin polyglutamylase TTLL9 [Neosynchiropus ocellatus]